MIRAITKASEAIAATSRGGIKNVNHMFAGITAASMISGCSTTANLYPVQGPLAAQRPLPVVVATVDGTMGGTGGISMVMPGGETCVGKWSSAAPQMAVLTTTSLFGQYGSIAGFGTIVGPAPGVNRGEAFVTCAQGTTLQAEFFTGSGTASGYGVAKDSNGNVYKMLF
jgi:hypothetical protein